MWHDCPGAGQKRPTSSTVVSARTSSPVAQTLACPYAPRAQLGLRFLRGVPIAPARNRAQIVQSPPSSPIGNSPNPLSALRCPAGFRYDPPQSPLPATSIPPVVWCYGVPEYYRASCGSPASALPPALRLSSALRSPRSSPARNAAPTARYPLAAPAGREGESAAH